MRKILMFAIGVLVLAGCYNDAYNKLYPVPQNTTLNPCDTSAPTISFSSKIQPIISQNCANSSSCHAAGGASGYDYTDTTVLKQNALAGWIVQDINFQPSGRGHKSMPLNGAQISSCDIGLITRWVNLGAICNN